MTDDGELDGLLGRLMAGRPVPVAAAAGRKSDMTKRRILDAAMREIISGGIAGLSLRNIASEIGVSLGNLTYHFPSKAVLIEAMVDDRIADYAETFQEILSRKEGGPRDQLAAIVTALVDDLRTAEIAFFPQLWAHAVVDQASWVQMHKLYDLERTIFTNLLRSAAPDMPLPDAEGIALIVQSAIEGLTIFIGMDRKSEGVFADPARVLLELIDSKLGLEGVSTGPVRVR